MKPKFPGMAALTIGELDAFAERLIELLSKYTGGSSYGTSIYVSRDTLQSAIEKTFREMAREKENTEAAP